MIQTPHQVLDARHRSPRFQGRCALAVMAKVPHAGRVKTRLSPPLNLEQAAVLNIAFLKDTVACLEQVSIALPADRRIVHSSGRRSASSEDSSESCRFTHAAWRGLRRTSAVHGRRPV
jgi:hypothetical protein